MLNIDILTEIFQCTVMDAHLNLHVIFVILTPHPSTLYLPRMMVGPVGPRQSCTMNTAAWHSCSVKLVEVLVDVNKRITRFGFINLTFWEDPMSTDFSYTEFQIHKVVYINMCRTVSGWGCRTTLAGLLHGARLVTLVVVL